MKKRVLIIGTAANTGGGISSVIHLLKKMEVWNQYSCYWLETQTQSGPLVKMYLAIKALIVSIFIMWRYDIAHFHIVPGTGLLIQLPEFIIAKLYRKKTIIEIHVGNQLTRHTHNTLFRWWLSHASEIVFLAYKWEKLFKELYKDISTPTSVLYNACDMSDACSLEHKSKSIIMAANLSKNKAPDLLIKAWKNLYKKYPDWKITIMGGGDVATYSSMVHDYGLEHCISFPGYLTGEAKRKSWNEASIYCMCSYAEGFPMVVLEAWKNSVAVITTPVGGLPDVIIDGENCLTFPFGDSSYLEKQLERLIEDKCLWNSLVTNAKELVSSTFSLDMVNDFVDKLYQRVLKY